MGCDPPQTPIDAAQEAARGGGVGGVAAHHLVALREALGRDGQRETDLPAVAPPVWAEVVLALGKATGQRAPGLIQ